MKTAHLCLCAQAPLAKTDRDTWFSSSAESRRVSGFTAKFFNILWSVLCLVSLRFLSARPRVITLALILRQSVEI